MDSNEVKKRDLYLIKSTLKGNNDSFAKLMTYYKQRVLVFGKSFFHNETDAEDFVQDVFIKVFINLKSFKGNFSLFSLKETITLSTLGSGTNCFLETKNSFFTL